MSDNKHTPGCDPLEAQFAELRRQLEGYMQAFDCINEAVGFAHRAISDPDSIAVVDLPTESKEATARLIAAAPELLEAASEVMRLLEYHGPPIVAHIMDTDDNAGQRLRAAIAKAKGEQP